MLFHILLCVVLLATDVTGELLFLSVHDHFRALVHDARKVHVKLKNRYENLPHLTLRLWSGYLMNSMVLGYSGGLMI